MRKTSNGYTIRKADGWYRGRLRPAKLTDGRKVWWVILDGNNRDSFENRIAFTLAEAKAYARKTVWWYKMVRGGTGRSEYEHSLCQPRLPTLVQ